MLWVPTARLLVPQAAVRLLPVPVSEAARHPRRAMPLSVKPTLQAGLVQVTVTPVPAMARFVAPRQRRRGHAPAARTAAATSMMPTTAFVA